MGLVGGSVGYRILRAIAPAPPGEMTGSAYIGRSKLEILLGKSVWADVRDKTVVDFGCGSGAEAIELAQRGARQVYGVDIRQRWLEAAQSRAADANCRNVSFCTSPPEKADVLISLDAFEHFADPGEILTVMSKMLKPAGRVLASFGPTWRHPLGGHLFSVFPWAHLIFTEKALCHWRGHFRSDGAQRFNEVEGGLNQITIRRFEQLVRESPLRLEFLETVPIRRLRLLHNRLTREFLTAVVRCRLSLRNRSEAHVAG